MFCKNKLSELSLSFIFMILTIYFCVSLLLIIFFILDTCTVKLRNNKMLFYLGAVLVTGLLAFRGTYIGGDTPAYCGYFSGKGGWYGILETNNTFEWGFRMFCHFIAIFSRAEFWFLFTTSLVTMLPFLYLVKRDTHGSKILPLCQYMLLWGILSTTQTAIRQNISIGLIMLAYILLTTSTLSKRKKITYSILFVSFGLLTHNSSFIILPILIFCIFLKLTKRNAMIMVICSFFLIILFNDIFYRFSNVLSVITTYITPTQILFDRYFAGDMEAELRSSIFKLFAVTFFSCLIIYISNEEDVRSNYFKFFVVGVTTYIIGSSFPMISRSMQLILFMGIIFCPSYIRILRYNRWRMAIIITLLFLTKYQINMEPRGASQMYPYTFIWEPNNINTLKDNSIQFIK